MLLGRWNGHGTTSAQPRHRPAIIPSEPGPSEPGPATKQPPPGCPAAWPCDEGTTVKVRDDQPACGGVRSCGFPARIGSEQARADGRLPWPGPFGDQRRCPFPPPSPSTLFRGQYRASKAPNFAPPEGGRRALLAPGARKKRAANRRPSP